VSTGGVGRADDADEHGRQEDDDEGDTPRSAMVDGRDGPEGWIEVERHLPSFVESGTRGKVRGEGRSAVPGEVTVALPGT
jgi:hypothetical protein